MQIIFFIALIKLSLKGVIVLLYDYACAESYLVQTRQL